MANKNKNNNKKQESKKPVATPKAEIKPTEKAPKPAPKAAEGWTCECGAVNQGKFCMECGKKKPAGAPTFKCDKCGYVFPDPKNPGKFCPECGDPVDDNDIVK